MTPVMRIISGGQIGADIAGLRAARRLGLSTGGWMPRGWLTKLGPREDYAEEYGLQQHESPRYPPRTFANVRDSDGTVRFAFDFKSAGERCTLRAIAQYQRPYHDVPVSQAASIFEEDEIESFRYWLNEHNIACLNVAGNAQTWLEPIVEQFLVTALRR